ncbi:MAG: ribosome maturation factor RimM [Aeromicrobium sp.]|uniref:ribosome maturation factor RimM n=1 Tax=Aeromicrobium sp. TaxID=1871063 RepID=UPI0039E49CAC
MTAAQVVVGRVGRAHGIRGELAVEIRTDEPERRFAPGSSVVCAGRTLTVASARRHGARLVVRFAEIADRTEAETLHGQIVEAEVDDAETPGDDAFYDRQLIGLKVCAGGRTVGTVRRVDHLPSQDLLVIDVSGRDVLVPFVEALVPEIDLDVGTLTVVDLPGLLDPDAALAVRADGESGS